MTTEQMDQVDMQEAEERLTEMPSQIIGYHFAGMSFKPGEGGVATVGIGDNGIPGMVMIKVSFTGKRKARLFMVPLGAMVVEYNDSPVIVPSSPGLIVPG